MSSPTLPDRPRTAVVLGSGGARGYAHIGALEAIEARGFDIVALSGTSMGALVGGLRAAGVLDDYREWVTGLRQLDVLRLVDLSLSAGGAIRGEKVFSVVREMLGDTLIEDLPIAFTAVATDLLAQREVWFQDGLLADAIRASVAIPSLFSPVVNENQLLVDGALMNPVPILPTLSAQADITIAVHLSGDTRRHTPTRQGNPLTGPGEDVVTLDDVDEEQLITLRQRAARLFEWDNLRALLSRDSDEVSDDTALADIGRLDIVNLAYETMQATLTSYKLAGYPPDVLIEIPKSSARTFEFHRAPELIEIGRERAEEALDEAGFTLT